MILTQVLRTLASGLLPQDCLLCGDYVGDALLCGFCRQDFPCLPAARCPRCALPSPQAEVCGRCQRQPPAFDRVLACAPYVSPVDRMIQRLKYAHQLALADWFGDQLAVVCQGLQVDWIVPLPLHPRRLAERGFNQSVEIARRLGRHLQCPVSVDMCQRIRDTVPQTHLALSARRRNVRHAFVCDRALHGEHILLVDDVVTSGATVDECARVLRLHGAARVDVAAVARTVGW